MIRRALHDYATMTSGPGSAASPMFPCTSRSRGRYSRNSSSRSIPQALASGQPLDRFDVADRLNKEHRLKAVGRLDRGSLQYQVLADTLATDPLDLEDRVIAEKNGQSIRLREHSAG